MDLSMVYTTTEAARYLGLSPSTIRVYITSGKLVPDRKIRVNRLETSLFSRETLDQFNATREKPGRRWPKKEGSAT